MNLFPEVLRSKLTPPFWQAQTILRRELLQQLLTDWKQRKLTTIVAPAGYGKTVLAQQLAQNAGVPVVWYQVDEYDNDLVVFVSHLVAGFRRHLAGFGAEVVELLKKEERSAAVVRDTVAGLVNELAERLQGASLLVLDDYHFITAEPVHRWLAYFIRFIPPGVHLVIASRTPLPLPIASWRPFGLVMEVDWQSLRFSREEMADLGHLVTGRLPDGRMLAELEAQTEGWPLGVQLAYRARGAARASGPVERMGKEQLYEYFTVEVLHRQPPEIKDFLLASSVLDRLEPEVCDCLLKRRDSGAVLEDLVARGIFVVKLEAEPPAYRYHQLFRDFLRHQIKEGLTGWLRRAAECWQRAGNQAAALECLLMAGAHPESIPLVEDCAGEALRRGQWQTVARWLKSLPGEWRQGRPRLALYSAAVAIHQGRHAAAERWLVIAEKGFRDQQDSKGIAEVLLQRARLSRSQGKYAEAVGFLKRAQPYIAKQFTGSEYEFSIEESLALVLSGRFDEAEVLLKQFRRAAEEIGDGLVLAHAAIALSNLYFVRGEYAQALAFYQEAREAAPSGTWTPYFFRDSVALIYRDWGDLDEALHHAQEGVRAREEMGLTETLPYAYYQLGLISADLGRLREAERFYRQGIKVARQIKGERFFLALNLALLSQCLAKQGRLEAAEATAGEALSLAARQSEYLLGICREAVAPVFFISGKSSEALAMLQVAVASLERHGAKLPLCLSYGVLGAIYLAQGLKELGAGYAFRSLALAAENNYLQIFVSYFDTLQPVLRIGIEQGIHPSFIQEVLARVGEGALSLLEGLSRHPDASIRARTPAFLAGLGTPAARELLAELAWDQSPVVRRKALAAAGGVRGFPLEKFVCQPAVEEVPGQAVLPVRRTALKCFCLGFFRVFAGSTEIGAHGWRTTKARDLLAYLVHCGGRPVPKDELLDALWPEADPERASVLLHTNLYQLRRELQRATGCRELIVHANGSYRLLPGSYATDVYDFERLILVAREETAGASKRVAALERAVALYAGDYLGNIDYPWAAETREKLQRLWFQAREQLARIYLEQGDYPRAMEHLRVLLGANPFWEEGHRLAMQAYAAVGDRRAAARQYRRLVRLLRQELGVAPEAATTMLFTRLCNKGGPPSSASKGTP